MTILDNISYSPGHAEKGKFLVANLSDGQYSTYPVEGQGKYNVIVHPITNVNFASAYSPSWAEHGKFTAMAASAFTDYEPLSGYGKYGIYTYKVSSVDFTQAYTPFRAENGKFVTTSVPPCGNRYAILTYDVPLSSCDLTIAYNNAQAEQGKFVRVSDGSLPGYPVDGEGKYAVLTVSMSAVSATVAYNDAQAERGKFVRINDADLVGYEALSGQGKYAMLVYEV